VISTASLACALGGAVIEPAPPAQWRAQNDRAPKKPSSFPIVGRRRPKERFATMSLFQRPIERRRILVAAANAFRIIMTRDWSGSAVAQLKIPDGPVVLLLHKVKGNAQ